MADRVTPEKMPLIEKLPVAIRDKARDMLIAGRPSRAVSAYLAAQGYKLSHNAVNKYNQQVLKPALKTAAKLAKMQAVEKHVNPSPVEFTRELKEITKQQLTANSVIDRVKRKLERIDGVLPDVYASRNIGEICQLEAVESKAIELLGKATQDPGFVSSAPQVNVDRQLVIVMPTAQALPQGTPALIEGDVIDVEVGD